MKKTQFGATILEGSDIADLPLVSRNAQILEDEILKDRSKLEDKVDKVSGKGLSTNDFTNAHKKSLETDIPDKLSKLEQGLAGAGKVETVNNIKPDSNKNIKLTGANIAYKDGVTENIATKISKMDTEIDTVKQSGVKSNTRLSDKLNSLEIPASDKDSIDTNVGKFENIPNHGSLNKTITTQNSKQIITPGYYEGGEVKAQFNNLNPKNIKRGVNVGGVVGTLSFPSHLLFEDMVLLQTYYWEDLEINRESYGPASYGVDGKGLDLTGYDLIYIVTKTTENNNGLYIKLASTSSTEIQLRARTASHVVTKDMIYLQRTGSTEWRTTQMDYSALSSGYLDINSYNSKPIKLNNVSTRMALYPRNDHYNRQNYKDYTIEVYGIVK